MYDTLYQSWLVAKQEKDYREADRIREEFEYLHGLTIYAVGDVPIENVTVRRMSITQWIRKYGTPKQLEAEILTESKFGPIPYLG